MKLTNKIEQIFSTGGVLGVPIRDVMKEKMFRGNMGETVVTTIGDFEHAYTITINFRSGLRGNSLI